MKQSIDARNAPGATDQVYRGILADLEQGRMVPGQRLVETDLAVRFGVGRNAVREAMQRLAVRGVVDLSRHRSPAIRQLDMAETLEVLEVAQALTTLLVVAASHRFDPARDSEKLSASRLLLEKAASEDEPGQFSQARRAFYRTLLDIAGNRELQRLFPAVGMHIIYAQYQTPVLRGIRLADYCAMLGAVEARDPEAARTAADEHLAAVAAIVRSRARVAG